MGFGSIWMIFPMAVIVWAILRVAERGRGRHEPRGPVEPDAQEILEQRYAAGDLSDEQYETMRAHLNPPPKPKAAWYLRRTGKNLNGAETRRPGEDLLYHPAELLCGTDKEQQP